MPNELAYCEIYKPVQHGILNDSYNKLKIYSSFIYQLELSLDEFYDNGVETTRQEWEKQGPWLGDYSLPEEYYDDSSIFHNPFIRNSCAIKLNELQIVERVYYEDYIFCILKTCWLKIFQRKWKKYYHSMMERRKNIKNLQWRAIHGKWR